MAYWRVLTLWVVLIPTAYTLKKQGKDKKVYTTETTPEGWEAFEHVKMSKEYHNKPGSRIEPVIFEPQRKIKLSRSTYKVNSYIDFKPYKETFKQFGYYMNKFIIDLHDPHYVSTLYNVDRLEGEAPIKIGTNVKKHFGTFNCRQATYKCRIQNQYLQLKRGALKVNAICRSTHQKFLRAIDHMEFHPTLGRPKTGPGVRLKRSSQENERKGAGGYVKQIEDLTDGDMRMLRQAVQMLDTQYLNKNNKTIRRKRFGLASWVMGWGFLQTYSSIGAIKNNIRSLQEQNLLQQNQIIELSHYLNITYGHVSSNRYAITNLQVRMAEVNRTLIAALSDVKFVKILNGKNQQHQDNLGQVDSRSYKFRAECKCHM